MPSCHDMKMDEVYICEDCGVELKVVKECCKADEPEETCECAPCVISCCGEELKKKE